MILQTVLRNNDLRELEANFNLYKSAKLNIFQLFTYEQLEL